MNMIRIEVLFELTNGYVVQVGNIRYVLSDADIYFEAPYAYTYPSKLVQVYNG